MKIKKKFDVILYAVVKIKVPGIMADTPLDAAMVARKIADPNEIFRATCREDIRSGAFTEYAEEITHVLVDAKSHDDMIESTAIFSEEDII